jgi:hypothetical protein
MITAIGVVFIATAVAFTASAASAASSGYQPFSSPAAAAQRFTVALRGEGLHLFHPCAATNPYLIRCGGFIGKAGSSLGRSRVTIVWRKVNPYMLEKTTTMWGAVFEHRLVDTRVAY